MRSLLLNSRAGEKRRTTKPVYPKSECGISMVIQQPLLSKLSSSRNTPIRLRSSSLLGPAVLCHHTRLSHSQKHPLLPLWQALSPWFTKILKASPHALFLCSCLAREPKSRTWTRELPSSTHADFTTTSLSA
jgi:hypothetical protein